HSQWMLQHNVFSHTGIGGSSATQRMRDAGFDFSGSWRSAENIAVQSERGAAGIMDDVQNLHTSLMNSPGHRANILNPALDYIGIGIETGNYSFSSGTYKSVIVTQTRCRGHP
ncbi:CAP domain-containing protein, partial [Lacimonas salitolerans]